jgi:FKBP-type peptidyl-prolyl cis-trans isomerase
MLRTTALSLAVLTALSGAVRAGESPAEDVPPELALDTDDRRIVYVLGRALGGVAAQRYYLRPEEFPLFLSAVEEALRGEPARLEDTETYRRQAGQFMFSRRTDREAEMRIATAEERAAAEREFVEEMADAPGAVVDPSGLVYFELEAGDGPSPGPADRVTVRYVGTHRSGTVFDRSPSSGEPRSFSLDSVIPCWRQGLQRMRVGGKARLVCPASLAYGREGAMPRIGPDATLIFEVELLEVEPAP